MKQTMILPELLDFMKSENIIVSDQQFKQLEIYYSELAEWSKRINLISKGDIKYIVERHFVPALYYLKYLKLDNIQSNQSILDLGTGAGFPGLLLAIFLQNRILMIDSNRKKTLFLKNVQQLTGLNYKVTCSRIEEDVFAKNNKFDIITARAVAPIPKLINLAWPVLEDDGYLLSLKGDDYKIEFVSNNLQNSKISELEPLKKWQEFSPYLKNKIMLKLEKNNV